VPGLVHRYPDRVLFLVTDRCAAYCRYCTRSRLVSNAQDYNFHPEYEQGLRYIEAHPEVRDVLLSGGDPLLLSDKKLEHLSAACARSSTSSSSASARGSPSSCPSGSRPSSARSSRNTARSG
jgi:L-lysine 2,3-aminomutase